MSIGSVDPGAGRTRVIVDDEGAPYTLFIPAIDCRSFGSFTTIPASLQVKGLKDPNGQKRGPWARGEVTLGSTVVFPTGISFDTVAIEVNVIGTRGGAATVLGSFALGPLRSQAFLAVDEPFEELSFEARLVVNGVPQALSASAMKTANMTLSGRFWR